MSFVGGKLKLKGADPLKGGVKKKKKKKAESTETNAAGEDEIKASIEGYKLAPPKEGTDMRTEAEKKYEAAMTKREAERIKKQASKTHRERVNEFNQYLTNLSEHHDIPKVGPG
ncbi:hypothetical protein WJX72_007105 [[Myrmecia] bisecta]|uniref:Protein FAM32A n=1 Tax=[Myrmecia] bisecta TaxID=41462 RepID=A0AAW1PP14_9CHLO